MLVTQMFISVFKCVGDLGGCVDVSPLSKQQARHFSMALLRCQVQRADPLLSQNVRLCTVLQQR